MISIFLRLTVELAGKYRYALVDIYCLFRHVRQERIDQPPLVLNSLIFYALQIYVIHSMS